MKGDFTRVTFDPARHASRVLMQQGRVQLDADFNEQSAILLRYLRLLATDLLGPHAGPDGAALGFEIAVKGAGVDLAAVEPDPARRKQLQDGLDKGDVVIGPGRYYVRGVLVENDRARLFSEQPGYPFAGAPIATLTRRAEPVLFYLDVWERHVTYADDDTIREVALGGVDTCSRAEVAWQVRALTPGQEGRTVDCASVGTWAATGDGRLRARARRDRPDADACVISADARYRGAENQLYRVEIHAGGRVGAPGDEPAFKWSRENGSVILPVRSVAGTTVTVEHLGRDRRTTLSPGDWVEFVDDPVVFQEAAGPLARVEAIDRDELTVTLTLPAGASPLPALTTEQAAARHAQLRRWDHAGDPAVAGGALPVVESPSTPDGLKGGWIALEDGVEVWFERGHRYREGDYWLVPARVATGDVEWPVERDDLGAVVLDEDGNPIGAARPPNGPAHYFAPLRLLPRADGGGPAGGDCRCRIKRLPCSYTYAFSRAGIGGDNL